MKGANIIKIVEMKNEIIKVVLIDFLNPRSSCFPFNRLRIGNKTEENVRIGEIEPMPAAQLPPIHSSTGAAL